MTALCCKACSNARYAAVQALPAYEDLHKHSQIICTISGLGPGFWQHRCMHPYCSVEGLWIVKKRGNPFRPQTVSSVQNKLACHGITVRNKTTVGGAEHMQATSVTTYLHLT